MHSDLLNELRRLPASGEGSFERLIADLLGGLTGRRFYVAKAGRQSGHDAVSDATAGSRTSIECKRYLENTALNERELLGELVQACHTVPDLDLWVLVASRDIHAQLLNDLIAAGDDKGVAILAISAGDGNPSSLEALCATNSEVVLNYLCAKVNEDRRSALEKQLQAISNAPGFAGVLSRLRSEFSPAHIGYDHWRAAQNQHFRNCCSSDAGSRAAFGQPLNVEDGNIKLIHRRRAWEQLDSWLEGWRQKHDFFVLTGEEGDGKTWAVASWLTKYTQTSASCPPVIFISSSRVVSSEPQKLLQNVINDTTSVRNEEYWGKRLRHWMQRPPENTPALILVLDGINERHGFSWWRELLQQLVDKPWYNRVAVIITCRSSYWQQYFASLRSWPVHQHELTPYDDEELTEALKQHDLRTVDLPSDVLPLVRKPRYLDLVVKHRSRMADSGDVTVARLVYEDWRDRYERKNQTPLSDTNFQNLIREMARRHRGGVHSMMPGELKELLPFVEDPEAVYRELTTGGIMQLKQGRLRVQERLLPHGLGLLLADEVEVACKDTESEPTEAVARWLEPHSGLDIKAAICEVAVLHALQVPDYSMAGRVALLSAWVSSQNPTPDIEQAFPAYLPLSPQAYIELAEVVWSEATENRWAQELFMRALFQWRKSPHVSTILVPTFERWLSFVHPPVNDTVKRAHLAEK